MQNISESTPGADTRPVPLQLHGVLVRVEGTGVLLLGESGIGKSECALELITNGHQLVADDVIEVSREQDRIFGRAPELTRDHLEIRGLGILNVRDLYGDGAVCGESVIDLCIELRDQPEVERLGIDLDELSIAGGSIRKFTLPSGSSRNLATLVMTAVWMLKLPGRQSAPPESLLQKHAALLNAGSQQR